MKSIIAIALLMSASAVFAGDFKVMDFNFIAPSVPDAADAPNQIGLIVFDSNAQTFKGRAGSTWKELGGGVNADLSNLTPTAINQSLVPASDGGISLGAPGKRVDTLFIRDGIRAPEFDNSFLHFYPGDGGVTLSSTQYMGLAAWGPAMQIVTANQNSPGNINIITNSTALGWYPPNPGVDTGVVTLGSGQAYGSANSGGVNIITGSTAANSGDINITTGSAGGNRGTVSVSARALVMPTASSDPSAPEGSVYFNTSSKKFRGFDGTSWTDLN